MSLENRKINGLKLVKKIVDRFIYKILKSFIKHSFYCMFLLTLVQSFLLDLAMHKSIVHYYLLINDVQVQITIDINVSYTDRCEMLKA